MPRAAKCFNLTDYDLFIWAGVADDLSHNGYREHVLTFAGYGRFA